ncbi:hypothetical protein IFM89_026567 [Coptis chinensis]|uniref:F-box associated beta-propeller type 3 domain-containing protein n=1 Tax=Coptis chinensis TaxID=261450 RepID=A0A835LKK0_9MAGN|nr:hypothetical protein IFM89_026567 [Coptis chinensis]
MVKRQRGGRGDSSKSNSKEQEVTQGDEAKKVIMPYLNHDLVFNIFTRIPADILLDKFKYQCKRWFNIVSDPVFIDAHTMKSEAVCLLQEFMTDDSENVELRFLNLNGSEISKVRVLNEFPKNLRFFRPCNGLLVGEDYFQNLCVTNPTTKELITVPRPHGEMCRILYDVVYVPSTKKYKLVELFYTGVFLFHVQTLDAHSRNTWRRINETSVLSTNILILLYARVSVKGILYVSTSSGGDTISFDIDNEETIRSLKLPTADCCSKSLMEMDGFLAIIDNMHVRGSPYDVWILKDVDRQEWVKQFRIDTLPVNISEQCDGLARALGKISNGEVIFFEGGNNRGQIVVYYVKTRQWEHLNTEEIEDKVCTTTMNFGFLKNIPQIGFISNHNTSHTPNPIAAITETTKQWMSYDYKILGWSLLSFIPWVGLKVKHRFHSTITVNRTDQQEYREPIRNLEPGGGCYVPLFRPYVAKVPWHSGARSFLSMMFPRYGHYCGPNWSSGKAGGSHLWDQRPRDWLDFCCYCHDIGYDTGDQAKLLKADLAFLECLERPRMSTKGNAGVAHLYKVMCIIGLRSILIPYRRHLVRLQEGQPLFHWMGSSNGKNAGQTL